VGKTPSTNKQLNLCHGPPSQSWCPNSVTAALLGSLRHTKYWPHHFSSTRRAVGLWRDPVRSCSLLFCRHEARVGPCKKVTALLESTPQNLVCPIHSGGSTLRGDGGKPLSNAVSSNAAAGSAHILVPTSWERMVCVPQVAFLFFVCSQVNIPRF